MSRSRDKFTPKFENSRVDVSVGSQLPDECHSKAHKHGISVQSCQIWAKCSLNILPMNYRTDLILGKAFCTVSSFHFPDSALFASTALHFIFKGAMLKTQQTCHLIWNRSDILCPPLNKLIVASWHHLERRSTTCSCNMDAAPSHLNLRWWGLQMLFPD